VLPYIAMDGWTALADPTRRSIFELVAARPRAVSEIAARVPVSRPAVSQHLKLLKSAHLVLDHAEGTRRIYCVNSDGLAKLPAHLDLLWSKALTTFKALVDEEA